MQDILSNNLNEIMNAKKANKKEIFVTRFQKLFIKVLEIMKQKEYLDYEVDEKSKKIKIKIQNLNETKAIKPRFYVTIGEIEKYVRRYLPARDYGYLIISTSKGLMTQDVALEKGIGGVLISYFY
jgi:small subunit ribosomal protein S8